MLKFSLPVLIAFCLLALGASGASAASATLTVDPATSIVDPGEEFTVTMKLHSDVDLAGAQTNIEFDRAVLQVVDITPSAVFQNAAFIIGSAPNNTKELAMAEANTSTGRLIAVATYFSSGSGSAPAGDNDFVIVTFRGVVGGTSAVSLITIGSQTQQPYIRMEATDPSGSPVPLTATGGQVTVTGATPTATLIGQTESPSPSPSSSPAPTPTASPALPVHASMAVSPGTIAVRPGSEFTVTIQQTTDQPTQGSQATFQFDPSLLQVESVTKGSTFSKASLSLVTAAGGASGQAAIDEANSTGVLKRISAFLIPPSTIASGSGTFLTIKIKARDGVSGGTSLSLSDLEMLKPDGTEIGVSSTNGHVDISNNAPLSLPSTGGTPASDSAAADWLLIFGGLAALSGGAAVYAARRRS